MKIELGDIQYYKNTYEWLLDLNDDELSWKIFDTNDVQNALIELLRFVDYVINLPVVMKQFTQVSNEEYIC